MTIDESLDAFEAAWRNRQSPPDIGDFLPEEDSAERAEALRELIKIDIDFRWRAAAAVSLSSTDPDTPADVAGPRVENYCESFPELGIADDCPTELILHEYRVRRMSGENPTVDEFLKRFASRAELLFGMLQQAEETLFSEAHSGDTLAESAVPDASTCKPGTRFGDYELISEIARGGMGVVFKARQVHADRIVALKMILQGQLADGELIRRFQTEARAAARLSHPGIVPVYDVGSVGGQHYFSMAFVEGTSLKEALEDGPLPPRDAAKLLADITAAVAYAHDNGILHRDLKPANVLIGADRQPRVTDFGLAKQMNATDELTASGQIMGTPHYMPPEQAAGRLEEIGPRSDVYSLGAILYFLIVGKPPFQAASTLDILAQVCERDPIAPRQHNPSIDRDLETICLKCLEKQPALRYQSAADLRDDLACFLQRRPIAARPVSRWNRAARWCRRNPLIAESAALAITALLLGTVFSTYFAIEASHRADEANAESQRVSKLLAANTVLLDEKQAALGEKEQALEKAKLEWNRAEAEKATAKTQLERAERQLYVRNIQTAHREWLANNIVAAKNSLAACKKEYRGWEYFHLRHFFTRDFLVLNQRFGPITDLAFHPNGKQLVICGTQPIVLDWTTGRVAQNLGRQAATFRNIDFSDDGRRLASIDGGGTVLIWDTSTWRPIQTFKGLRNPTAIDFSSDGAKVLCASYAQMRVFELGTKKTTDVNWKYAINNVAFHPDAKHIIYTTSNATYELDATQPALQTQKQFASGSTFISSSPDGKLILLMHPDKLTLVDSSTKQLVREFAHSSDEFYRMAFFSPNGRRIVTGSNRGVKVWSLATGRLLSTFRGHTDVITKVTFLPGGDYAVSGSRDGNIYLWRKGERRLLFPDTTSAVVSRSGDHLAVVARIRQTDTWGIQLLTARGTALGSIHRTQDARSVKLAFDGQGTLLAVGDRTGPIVVYDVKTRKERIRIPRPAGIVATAAVSAIALSPDGRQLAASISKDNIIRIWDTASGRMLRKLQGHQRSVHSLAYTDDGSEICSAAYDSTLRIWNPATGFLKKTMHVGRSSIKSLALRGDGQQIACGNNDGSVSLWSRSTGKLEHHWKAHQDVVQSVAYSPDGNRVVSGGNDRKVRIWDPVTGADLLTLRGHDNAIIHVAFANNGKSLAGIGYGGRIRFWDSEPVAAATTRPRSNVSPDRLARQGQWQAAETALESYLKKTPGDRDFVFRLAVLYAKNGNSQYAEHCRKLLERFQNTTRPEFAERVAKVCLVIPAEKGNLAAATKLADKAVTLQPNHWVMPWAECARALSAYRNGDFAGAKQWAEKCLARPQTSDAWYRTVQAQLVLAMAQSQLKQPEAARKSYRKAVALLEPRTAAFRKQDFDINWHDWLIADILSREAKDLLKEQ